MPKTSLPALITLLFLTACGTTRTPEPRVEIRTVNVPIAVSCIPPEFHAQPPAHADLGVGETGAVIQAMAAELLAWRAFGDQAAPVLASCRRMGSSSADH